MESIRMDLPAPVSPVDVQPRLKMNFCLLDDRDIFNLQAA